MEGRYRLAVLNIGAPASGMNSAVRSFVRHAITAGCVCLGVQDGFEGLVMGMVKPIEWKSVNGWTGIGGSILGCQQIDAEQVGLELIARKIREFKIDGMVNRFVVVILIATILWSKDHSRRLQSVYVSVSNETEAEHIQRVLDPFNLHTSDNKQ